MAVGMSHQLVAFLARGVEAEGVINVVMYRKGHRRVCPVDTRAARVHQVFNTVVTAAFQYMGEPDDVAIDVGERILDGIAHASLCGKVDDALWFMAAKALLNALRSA